MSRGGEEGIQLTMAKKPTIGDYLRSGSCAGDPPVSSAHLFNGGGSVFFCCCTQPFSCSKMLWTA